MKKAYELTERELSILYGTLNGETSRRDKLKRKLIHALLYTAAAVAVMLIVWLCLIMLNGFMVWVGLPV